MRKPELILVSAVVVGCVVPTDNNLGEEGGSSGTDGSTAGATTVSSTGSTGSTASTGTTASTGETSATTDAETETMGDTESAVCGNGDVEADEVCDDGVNDGAYGGCEEDCSALGPHCGDGELQRTQGEVCDDADDIDGNGCNVDCLESGRVLWTETYSEDEGESLELGLDVDVGADGTIFVFGQALTSEGLGDPPIYSILLWYDPDGTLTDTRTPSAVFDGGALSGAGYVLFRTGDFEAVGAQVSGYDALHSNLWNRPFPTANVWGIAVDAEDAVYVAGGFDETTTLFGPRAPLRAKLDDGGGVVWQQIDAAETSGCSDVGLLEGVGALFTCAWYTEWFDPDGGELQQQALDMLLLDTRADGSFAGTSLAGVASYDETGAELWATKASITIEDLAVDGSGNVVVAGYDGVDIAVTKYSAEGEEYWSATYSEAEPSSAQGVAIAPDDTIVVVGIVERFSTGQGADIWLRKYAP